jgi:hypothetical protein
MRNSIIITILVCFFSNAFCQHKVLEKKTIAGKDRNIYISRLFSIDKENNKYVFGEFKNSFISGTNQIQSSYDFGYYLTMYDKNDSCKWLINIAESIKEPNNINSCKIKNTSIISDNNACYISFMFVDTIKVNSITYISRGQEDILIIKVKNNGQIQFINQIGNENSNGFTSDPLAVDNNNDIYFVNVLATSNNLYTELVFGQDTVKTNVSCAYFVKMDVNGNYLWAKTKLSNNGHLFSLSNLCWNNNSLYALGYAYVNNFQIDSVDINIPVDFSNKYYLVKFDNFGKAQWARFFGIKSFGTFIPKDLVVANDKLYFSSYSTEYQFFFQSSNWLGYSSVSGYNVLPQGDYFIACYDTAGNYKWAKASQSYGSELITQLSADSNNNLLAVGYFDYTMAMGTDTLNTYGGDDAFVTSLDSNGNYLWSTSAGGAGVEVGNGIATTTDGDIYVIGGTSSNTCYFGQDAVQVDSLPSMFLAKIVNATPVGLQNFSKEDFWEVFPNPASTMLEIRCPMVGKKEIQLYNAVGQLVINLKTEHQTLNIETSKLPEGIYFLQLKQQGNTSTKKINIIY